MYDSMNFMDTVRETGATDETTAAYRSGIGDVIIAPAPTAGQGSWPTQLTGLGEVPTTERSYTQTELMWLAIPLVVIVLAAFAAICYVAKD
jgi:hypothetical protein